MATPPPAARKEKVLEEEPAQASAMDELSGAFGYKVKSSDMMHGARKLDQLKMATGTNMAGGISQHSGTVHYNPSDISCRVQNILSAFNTSDPNLLGQSNQVPSTIIDFTNGNLTNSRNDLSVLAGGNMGSLYGQELGAGDFINVNQRLRLSDILSADLPRTADLARPLVVIDNQEASGVGLVNALIACADAIQMENLQVAHALLKQINFLAVSQVGPMRKVAIHFAGALAMRLYKIYPQNSIEFLNSNVLHTHFYEACPYLKFAHFTANQAMLDAFAGVNRVHIIDFSLKQGTQWPGLMQALALRPGGPPAFRLTGIGPPQPDNTDALQAAGWKLAQLAETIAVEFEFRGYVANSLVDIDASMLNIRPNEVVAVNSIFELHRLLAWPGAMEKVLNFIKVMKPRIVTVVEQESNHNGPVFVQRFNEALSYYSTMFDSLESAELSQPNNSHDVLMSEMYLGHQINNVVACEEVDRVERHETLIQWRLRMGVAGFDPVHLGSNAFNQASMLLSLLVGGDEYQVQENDGCLMLCWHNRPVTATSAWQLSGGAQQ